MIILIYDLFDLFDLFDFDFDLIEQGKAKVSKIKN